MSDKNITLYQIDGGFCRLYLRDENKQSYCFQENGYGGHISFECFYSKPDKEPESAIEYKHLLECIRLPEEQESEPHMLTIFRSWLSKEITK